MRAGDLYASTGVVLDRLEWGPEGIRLSICPEGDALYTTRFIGTEGAVLNEVFGFWGHIPQSPCPRGLSPLHSPFFISWPAVKAITTYGLSI